MTERDDRRCSTALVEVSTWSFGKRQEAVNGHKKESQRQDQGKAQEDLAHRGDYPQKNQEGQKKTGEEGASPAHITKESQAGRERRDQTDAG
jgi:hypothetical protein